MPDELMKKNRRCAVPTACGPLKNAHPGSIATQKNARAGTAKLRRNFAR